jgi:hypothetical protein
MGWACLGEPAAPKAAFGNPVISTDFLLCVYDNAGGSPHLLTEASVPASGTCGVKPCWTESSTGFKYKDRARMPDGALQLNLKGSLVAGKAQIVAKGKGTSLQLPAPLAIVQPVVTQLKNSAGACWEVTFTAPAVRNTTTQFSDKGG